MLISTLHRSLFWSFRFVRIFLMIFLHGSLGAAPSPSVAPIPNFTLVNQDGKSFEVYALKGNYVLVSFIFTRCPMPKMCPLTMKLSNQVGKKWRQMKGLPPLRILAVTLDPQHDTPRVLKNYGESHSVDFRYFTLATAEAKVINEFASSFNVIGIPSQSGLSHNVKTVLLDPELRELAQFKENEWQPESVLNEAFIRP